MGRVIMSGIVPLLSKPVVGTPLSKLDEGAIIKINEGGSPVEFYLAKHNYEPDLNGSDRELVVRKDCYDKRSWHSTNNNAYATSEIDNWLNSDYKNLLDAFVQEVIGITEFKYTPSGPAQVSTLKRATFLLSGTELNRAESWFNIEGSALSIANLLQIAYYNGAPVIQWTRSPYTEDTVYAVNLLTDGKAGNDRCICNYGARPCFTLPSTALVDDTGLLIG